MRRRRSSGALAAASLALCVAALPLAAQSEPAQEGALFLLLPVGARAIGMGQAVVADQPGSEAVWWNPAALARAEKREAAIHHSQTVVATGDAVSVVIPSSLLGVIVGSVNILNFLNDGDVTDDMGNVVGKLLVRSFVYAATYATPIGSRVNAGLTYKVVQFRADCSGDCTTAPSFSASTSALDFGAQYDFGSAAPISVGAVVRNLGLHLQVNDNPQADALPTRLQVGVLYRAATIDRPEGKTQVRFTGDLLDDLRPSHPAVHLGADVFWNDRVHARAGYRFDRSEGAGPSIGLGIVAGSLVVDVARVFEGFSADAGQPPMYLSLRYLF